VARDIVIDVRIQVRTNLLGRQLMEIGDETNQIINRRRRLFAHHVQLSAIAGRDDDSLGCRVLASERTHGGIESPAAEVQPFP
jgi:hypothetical protein